MATDAQRVMAAATSEETLLKAVIHYAETHGYRVMHPRPCLTKDGRYRTALQGTWAKGFPDLVMVNAEKRRVVFMELKSEKGDLEPEQRDWRDWLLAAGADWQLVKPSAWLDGTVDEVLA